MSKATVRLLAVLFAAPLLSTAAWRALPTTTSSSPEQSVATVELAGLTSQKRAVGASDLVVRIRLVPGE